MEFVSPGNIKLPLARRMQTCWFGYKAFVKTKTTRERANIAREDISFWREKLFTTFITYLLPICFVALVPGVIMGFRARFPIISFFDILTVVSITVILFAAPLKLSYRKALVFLVLYCLAIMLLLCLGALGPGIIYLLAISVFVTLTCPAWVASCSVGINFLICAALSATIYFKLFNIPLIHEYHAGAWIAVSSNLVFLSWVSILLITNILNHLEETNRKEFQLKNELQLQILDKMERNKLLLESEGHYKSLFSLSPTPMWVFDLETLVFLQVNKSAVQAYGYNCAEFLCMTLNDIMAEKDPRDFIECLLINLNKGHSYRLATQHLRKDGEQFNVEVICNYIPFKGKQAVLIIANDITEQINYTKAIESQNSRLLEIAFLQSHIVRAPLARLQGLIPLLKGSNVPADDKDLILEYILTSANELDEVIKNISDKILPAANQPSF